MSLLLNVSLRQMAIFIPDSAIVNSERKLTETTSVLVANLSKLGYDVSEPLLRALNATTPPFQLALLNTFREVMGVDKNWTPLVKGWDTPTGESILDHIFTFYNTIFKGKGTTLACGHIIPPETFPLERYNGCPFCGTPFEFGKIEVMGQGSKRKLLELWTMDNIQAFYKDLLSSKTPLDATQSDSLTILLAELPMPEGVQIGMKETLMLVIDTYVELDEANKAQALFTSPTDILRYLWYKKTGFLQIVEPKVIVKRNKRNSQNRHVVLDKSAKAELSKQAELKLKYDRKMCAIVANWLNKLPMEADKACEMMHPKRNMWVRFIRALRLAEYAQRKGYDNLQTLMDVFYNQRYQVWAGQLEQYRLRTDAEQTFKLLKQRPGLFARSLFANMLWFGPDVTLEAFKEVIDKVPARLVFTLNMYAQNYFNRSVMRTVKPLGGISKSIAPNRLLALYDEVQLDAMKAQIEDLCVLAMQKRFAAMETTNTRMYIEPMLYKMPVAIGDRSETVQDMPVALMGTRFPVEGNTVRLFLQWGQGLPAQHLDMDLSCRVTYEKQVETCYFGNLTTTGCKHSGDIQYIPDQVGTAEYIDINIDELAKAKAQYVTFTCNAYTNGSLAPNLVVGWMNSKFPMHISNETGVAYDPSCVQHQVRIAQNVSKGLVFGILEVATREIIWMEIPFEGQVANNLDLRTVKGLLAKLDSKLSVGRLLALKAEAQKMTLVDNSEEADEVYTMQWAINAAAVTQLLVD